MVVGTAGDNLVALADKGVAQGRRILHDLLLILAVLRLGSLVEGYCLGGDNVLQGASLYSGEYAGIQDGAHLLYLALGGGDAPGVVEVLAHKDDASAGAAQGLMGGGGDYVGIFHGVLKEPGGDEAGRMCHIYPQQGAYLIGNGPHPFVVPFAGIGRCPADNKLGTAFQGLALHLVVVHEAGFGVEAVGDGLVQDTRGIDWGTVGEVAAHREVQTHKNVAGLEYGHSHGHIGLGAAVRLHIGIFGIVEGFQAVYGQLLYLVHHLAAAVVAPAGVALGIFVGADRTHSLQHLGRYIILGSNQFQPRGLAFLLLLYKVEDLKIGLHRSLLF